MSWSLVADLPKVVRTEGHGFVAIGNGHGREMALSNTLSPATRCRDRLGPVRHHLGVVL
ncbi:MAG: hypothetical protein R2710_14615 [Acidimicrobiales bacterium]